MRSGSDRNRKDRHAGFALLLITSIGWGPNWPIIKLLLREWPPLFARGTAGLTAAAVLATVAYVRGERLSLPSAVLGRLGAAAFLNVFAWMGVSTVAMVWLTVSEGAPAAREAVPNASCEFQCEMRPRQPPLVG